MYCGPTIINRGSTPEGLKPRVSKIGKIFILVFLIVVFEGAIRKWVSSAFTGPLVLIRDGLALYAIYLSLKTGHLKLTQGGAQLLKLWTYLFLGWGLLQLIVNQNSPIIFMIGIRFWLLYLWFSYAVAVSITEYDFNYIGKIIVATLLVMTPLAVIQHFLPPSAFLNKQIDNDDSAVFLVAEGVVRTTGTFSFTLGFTTLLSLATPFFLCLLAPGKKMWNSKWFAKFGILILSIATLVSGSRAAIIFFVFMFLAYVVAALIYYRSSKKVITLLMLIGICLLFASVPYLLPSVISANENRFETAAQSEELSARIISMFTGEVGVFKSLTLIGSGVGFGTNFAGTVVTGQRTFLLAETEVARTILEGGLLGFAFVGLKLLVIINGIKKSFIILKYRSNTFPLLIWIVTTLALLSWSIIGQLTVNALGYMLLGLAIASLRFSGRRI